MTHPPSHLARTVVPAVLVVSLLAFNWVAIRGMHRAQASADGILRRQEVMATIQELGRRLTEAESPSRAPLPVADPVARQAFERAHAESKRLIGHLNELVSDNSLQRETLSKLSDRIEREFLATRTVLETDNAQSHQAGRTAENFRDGVHGEVDLLLSRLLAEEARLLGDRTQEYRQLTARGSYFLYATAIVELVLLLGSIVIVRNHVRKLGRSQQFLQATIDSLDWEMVILDERGTIIAVNETWRQFGQRNGWAARGHGIGLNYLEVCERSQQAGSRDGRAVGDGLRELMRGERPRFQHQYPCHGPTEKRWFALTATRFEWFGDPRIVLVHELVTHRKLMEKRLRAAKLRAEAANRAKGSFLANMSHEIRTPLTAILGFSRLATEDAALAAVFPEHHANLEIIVRNGDHLLQLINDVLDLSKIEAGKLAPVDEPCDVRTLLAQVCDLFQPRLGEQAVSLRLVVAPDFPRCLQTDPRWLRQIAMNLLGNSVKFTPRGSIELRLDFEPTLSRLKLRVDDTGIGMSADQVRKLFQPFVQADSTASRRYGGTGLGLALSLRLARLLGGDITAKSELGQGSEFTLTLPAPLVDEDAIAETSRHVSALCQPPPTVRGRVLLAEDGPDNQRLIRLLLNKAGVEVTVVENGELAVAAAMQGVRAGAPFDLILMDMQMPVMSGDEATRRLRQRGYERPIVALTASVLQQEQSGFRAAGCDDVLGKPIDPKRFAAVVCGIVERAAPKPATHRPVDKVPV